MGLLDIGIDFKILKEGKMEKVENQFDWQIIFGPKRIIGIGVLIIAMTLTVLYGVWASSIPWLGMIIIGFILIGLGAVGLVILLVLYFAEIRTKQKVLALAKEMKAGLLGSSPSPHTILRQLELIRKDQKRKRKKE